MVFTVHLIYTYLYKYNKNKNTLTIYWLLPTYLQNLASSSNRTFTNDYKKKRKKNQPMLACFNSLLLNELIHFPPQHY